MLKINCVSIGIAPPEWGLGERFLAEPSVASVAAQLAAAAQGDADSVYVHDTAFRIPPSNLLLRLAEGNEDVWHAGPGLGLRTLPRLLDCVRPLWMLGVEPEPSVEAASWRISLGRSLFKAKSLQALAGLDLRMSTLTGAGLELGHRWLKAGAFMRYSPELAQGVTASPPSLPLEEELLFVRLGFKNHQFLWTALRALMTESQKQEVLYSAARVRRQLPSRPALSLARSPGHNGASGSVSIIIPTVQRYPYLRKLLSQLGSQSVRPHEVIIVDQTPHQERDLQIGEAFPELPLRVFYQDSPGQCSSRNRAVRAATGEYLLFLDDDDEVLPDLIERHLETIQAFRVDVSSGLALEDGAPDPRATITNVRMADIFPTHNSLMRRDALHSSGLFDLAYERRSRADGDLGIRLRLSGARMVVNPAICVVHRHAAEGGLRVHKARVTTFAASRRSLLAFHLPSPSELYLGRRYFEARAVREFILQKVLGTFVNHGSIPRRLAKAALATALLPATLGRIRLSLSEAKAMARDFPRIPTLAVEPDPQ